MTKKAKILIILLVVFLALVSYLILTSGSVKKTDNSVQPSAKKNVILSGEAYKTKVKEIFTAYEEMASAGSLKPDKIDELKNKLLDLRVDLKTRNEFEKLPFSFIQAMNKMENYLSTKDEQEKNAGQQMINQLKVDYSWLND